MGEFTSAFPGQTLTLYWNGSAWKAVKSPNAPAGNNNLLAASAVSSTDVWAVGFFQAASGSPRLTLTEHWNGHRWSVVPSPSPGAADNILLAVAAVSSTDVWAVGSFVVSGFGPSQTLIEHWDGRTWSVVASPGASTQNNELNGQVQATRRPRPGPTADRPALRRSAAGHAPVNRADLRHVMREGSRRLSAPPGVGCRGLHRGAG